MPFPPEVFKLDDLALPSRLTDLYQSMWQQKHLPQDFRDATIVRM